MGIGRNVRNALLKGLACLLAAVLFAVIPEHAGLSEAGRVSLGIVVFASGLWISEAIPAFAVALLVIALQIVLLSGLLDSAATGARDAWPMFVAPWSSAPMWIFFAGLMMARAAERAGIATWFAERALHHARGDGRRVLWALMAITFTFSMFVSNTAMAALMLSVLATLMARIDDDRDGRRMRAALLVGVAFSANLGGMGTLIGTPPNAIAAGLLAPSAAIRFSDWMVLGLPPAIVLAGWIAYVAGRALKGRRLPAIGPHGGGAVEMPAAWQRVLVVVVFAATVLLWLTEPFHGWPSAVVAFLPLVALPTLRIVRATDLRTLPWDVLLLIAGGMSLGVGVLESGLADWLVGELAIAGAPDWALALGLAYLVALLSNFMSNTAAANLVLPVAIALGLEAGGAMLAVKIAVPVALAASSAMCLPVSTPPNALIFATGFVPVARLVETGIVVGVLAPPLAVGWCFAVL